MWVKFGFVLERGETRSREAIGLPKDKVVSSSQIFDRSETNRKLSCLINHLDGS